MTQQSQRNRPAAAPAHPRAAAAFVLSAAASALGKTAGELRRSVPAGEGETGFALLLAAMALAAHLVRHFDSFVR